MPKANHLIGLVLLLVGAWVLMAEVARRSDSENTYTWNLPKGFPKPGVPADNPMTAEKVELGRHLFYDDTYVGERSRWIVRNPLRASGDLPSLMAGRSALG